GEMPEDLSDSPLPRRRRGREPAARHARGQLRKLAWRGSEDPSDVLSLRVSQDAGGVLLKCLAHPLSLRRPGPHLSGRPFQALSVPTVSRFFGIVIRM